MSSPHQKFLAALASSKSQFAETGPIPSPPLADVDDAPSVVTPKSTTPLTSSAAKLRSPFQIPRLINPIVSLPSPEAAPGMGMGPGLMPRVISIPGLVVPSPPAPAQSANTNTTTPDQKGKNDMGRSAPRKNTVEPNIGEKHGMDNQSEKTGKKEAEHDHDHDPSTPRSVPAPPSDAGVESIFSGGRNLLVRRVPSKTLGMRGPVSANQEEVAQPQHHHKQQQQPDDRHSSPHEVHGHKPLGDRDADTDTDVHGSGSGAGRKRQGKDDDYDSRNKKQRYHPYPIPAPAPAPAAHVPQPYAHAPNFKYGSETEVEAEVEVEGLVFDPTAPIERYDYQTELVEPWDQVMGEITPFVQRWSEAYLKNAFSVVLIVNAHGATTTRNAAEKLNSGVDQILDEERKQAEARETIVQFQSEMKRVSAHLLTFGGPKM